MGLSAGAMRVLAPSDPLQPWMAAYLLYPCWVADPALSTQIDRAQVRRAAPLAALHGTARPYRACPAFSPPYTAALLAA